MPDSHIRNRSNNSTQMAIIGAGLAAAAGTAAFILAKRTGSAGVPIEGVSDAPDHVWRRGSARYEQDRVGNTVMILRPADALYAQWKDFTKFPTFMDNVERVEAIGGARSKWTIKAPAGTTVELVTRITEDRANELIAWKSEPDSEITTEGRVEFLPAPPGRGTMVRLVLSYDPPAGIFGKGIAKLMQREPNI